MKPITNLLAAGLLLIATQVSGQLITTFSPATLTNVVIGSNVSLQLRVTNFTNITSIQLPVLYNSSVLRLDSLDYPVLPGFGDTTAFSFPLPGKAIVSWFPNFSLYPTGVTVPANTAIFTMRFTVIGGGGSTTVNIGPAQFYPVEISSVAPGPSTVSYQNGGSTIGIVAPPQTGCTGTGNPPAAPVYTGFKIIANSIYIPQGERGCMPITVNDFTLITLMQYAIHWNPAVLQYECTRALNLPGDPGFGGNTANGTQTLVWYDPSPQLSGVTRANGAKLYEVCFKAIGAPGSQAIVTIDGIGFPPGSDGAEASNASNQNVWNAATPVKDTVFVMDAAAPGCAIEFTADIDSVMTGAATCIDVKVNKFFWASSTEFLLTYDPTKLTYQNIQLGANPLTLLTSGANSNFTQTSGQIKFNWSTATANGVTLPDNTTIFSVCFQSTATSGSTPINFSSGAPCTAGGAAIGVNRRNIGGVPIITHAGSVYTIQNTQAPNPALTATSPNCFGGSNGAITTAVTTGTAPFSYLWAGPNSFTSTQQNLSGLSAAGVYTVTVTATGGATATATATLTVPPALVLAQNQIVVQGISCFGGNDGGIGITPSGGTTPYTYLWQGPPTFPGGTGATLSNLQTGNYVVTITDAKTCQIVSSVILVPAPQPLGYSTGQTSITAVGCNGGNTGAITLAPTGGTTPYSVAWTGTGGYTGNGLTISNLAVGTYTATVTDAKSCTFVVAPAFQVQAAAPISMSVGAIDNVKCFNTASGAVTINVGGGAGGFSYVWKNPLDQVISNMQNPSGLAAGIYSVTATDAAGCTKVQSSITVQGPPSQLNVVTTATTPVVCPGSNTGSICLGINGGWPGAYTVSWTGNLPGIACPTGVTGGTYTATVTDAGGCSVVHTVTVNSPQAITSGTPVVVPVTCAGSGDGCVTIAPNGGNGAPFTVLWSNTSLSGAMICNLPGGNYAPTVTDAQGCTAVFAAINVPAPLLINVSPAIIGQTGVTNNGSISLTTNGGSGSGYVYQWVGPMGFSSMLEDISGLAGGVYTVTVTDGPCAITNSFTVPADNVMGQTLVSVTNSCNNDGCFSFEIPATAAGPFTITWTGNPVPQVATTTTPTFCGLAAGPYNITVTASNGNSVVLNTAVSQLQPALLNNTTLVQPFDNNQNGSISISALYPNSTFQWNYQNSTANALSQLDSGTYIVTVTNGLSGCTAVYTFNLVRQYNPFVANGTAANPTCLSTSNGSINLSVNGGDDPYTYLWTGPNGYTSTNKNISSLAPGTYTVTITDEGGTPHTQTFTLTVQSTLAVTNVNELSNYNGFQVSGESLCDGIASVIFTGNSGGATIQWSNGVTTAQNASLCGGPYSVSVTDALGCTSIWSDELTAPVVIGTIATIPSEVSCHGECDGIARVQVSGGVAPYTVNWSTGQSDLLTTVNGFSQAVNLCGGDYTVTVTDKNGVVKTFSVPVADPAAIVIEFNPVFPNSFNSCDGEILVEAPGAAIPATFTWAGSFGHSGQGQRAEGLCAGEVVQFIIQDANGCSAIATDTVPYPNDGCLQVRPIMTPGEQDGKNDYLLITCIETVSNSIEIYNRWGQPVFETIGYHNISNNWKGASKNGQPLAEGVYYYVLNFVDEFGNPKQQKGYINLLR